MDDFIAQFNTGEVIKPFSGAVARYHKIRIDLLQNRDDPADVGVVERRNDMEAADDGVHLLDTRDGLRLPMPR